MELTKLTHRLSTSPQIRPEEVADIAAAGFRSIVCNRPDGEEQGQPTADEIGGTRPSRLPWLLKDTILPPVYWHGMLKGREWMVKPHLTGA
jgi:Putative phosphatase (DUF442)